MRGETCLVEGSYEKIKRGKKKERETYLSLAREIFPFASAAAAVRIAKRFHSHVSIISDPLPIEWPLNIPGVMPLDESDRAAS